MDQCQLKMPDRRTKHSKRSHHHVILDRTLLSSRILYLRCIEAYSGQAATQQDKVDPWKHLHYHMERRVLSSMSRDLDPGSREATGPVAPDPIDPAAVTLYPVTPVPEAASVARLADPLCQPRRGERAVNPPPVSPPPVSFAVRRQRKPPDRPAAPNAPATPRRRTAAAARIPAVSPGSGFRRS